MSQLFSGKDSRATPYEKRPLSGTSNIIWSPDSIGIVRSSSSRAATGATEPTLPTHVRLVYHLLSGRLIPRALISSSNFFVEEH